MYELITYVIAGGTLMTLAIRLAVVGERNIMFVNTLRFVIVYSMFISGIGYALYAAHLATIQGVI